MSKDYMKVYKIELPNSTSPDIIGWFDQAYKKDQLAEAIIELVHFQIKSNNIVVSAPVEKAPLTEAESSDLLPNEILDQLYNWEASKQEILSKD